MTPKDVEQIRHKVFQRPWTFGRDALAVTPKIILNHSEVLAQDLGNRIPESARPGKAVNQKYNGRLTTARTGNLFTVDHTPGVGSVAALSGCVHANKRKR